MTNKDDDEPLSYFEQMRRNLDLIEANFTEMQQGIAATLDEIQRLINENTTRADQDQPKSN